MNPNVKHPSVGHKSSNILSQVNRISFQAHAAFLEHRTISFSVWKNTITHWNYKSTWFISAVPSISFTLESAHWMWQLFISQLQHLFCTYRPLAPCSLVGSRCIYSEMILPRPWLLADAPVRPLAKHPLHAAHFLRGMTKSIMQISSSSSFCV